MPSGKLSAGATLMLVTAPALPSLAMAMRSSRLSLKVLT
jgi:hypothetical protein